MATSAIQKDVHHGAAAPMGSSEAMRRYRARFDHDRASQVLTPHETHDLIRRVTSDTESKAFEAIRSKLVRMTMRSMGVVHHHLASYNSWVTRELHHQIRRMKPFCMYIPGSDETPENWFVHGRIHVFKFIACYVSLPTMRATDDHDQHIPMTCHEARQAMWPYSATVVVDIGHWTLCAPTTPDGKSTSPAPLLVRARYKLPEGWMASWRVEAKTLHLRERLFRFPIMTMSAADRRATGHEKPEAFAYEDHVDDGAKLQEKIAMFMPKLETLGFNTMYLFPGGTSAAVPDDESYCEWPDVREPYDARHARAFRNSRELLSRAFQLEIRNVHPALKHLSTATVKLRLSKARRDPGLRGRELTMHMQFLNVPIIPTVVWMTLGVALHDIIPLVQRVAGQHWYPEAFLPILRKLITRHPRNVTNEYLACLFVADRADKYKLDIESRLKYVFNEFLSKHLFPHIGLSYVYRGAKAMYLAMAVHHLLMKTCGFAFFDSKDDHLNQRVDSAGVLWGSYERRLLSHIQPQINRSFQQALETGQKLVCSTVLNVDKNTSNVDTAVCKGTWVTSRNKTGRQGVTQAVKETNFWTELSCCRRSNAASASNAKSRKRAVNSRQVPETALGDKCVIKTPEGPMCGISCDACMGSTVSPSCFRAALILVWWRHVPTGTFTPIAELGNGGDIVEIDGAPVWRTCTPDIAVHALRSLKRAACVSPYVSVYRDGPVVKVRTAQGRNVRVLINLRAFVTHGARITSFAEALRYGVLEFCDGCELQASTICFTLEDLVERAAYGEMFDKMELDPSNVAGLVANRNPFYDRNAPARSILASAMSTQAFQGLVNPNRIRVMQHMLDYPQRPTAVTRVTGDCQLADVSTSNTVLMGIALTDFTMEDSWELVREVSERGLCRISIERCYRAMVQNTPTSTGRVEKFGLAPSNARGRQLASYKIEDSGAPRVGTRVNAGDIVIGRMYTESLSSTWRDGAGALPEITYDDSVAVRDLSGVVQKVRTIVYGGGTYTVMEVVVRTLCLSEDGDKFATLHGQKGTAGIFRLAVDQLYSCVTGNPLAWVVNPIGILARLTAGHLHQMHVQKAAALIARHADATAFLTPSARDRVIDAAAVLMSHGMHPLGIERHINGTTGRMLDQPIFVGCMEVLALHHLTRLKVHARDKGPIKVNTRQADDGRARDGGLRFGQMEGDNCLALSMPSFLWEIWGLKSDAYPVAICKRCGHIAEYAPETGLKTCRVCMVGSRVQELPLSYPLKGFFQLQGTFNQRTMLCLVDEDAPRTNTVAQRAFEELDREAAQPGMHALAQVARPSELDFKRVGIAPPPSLRAYLRSMSIVRTDLATARKREEERLQLAAASTSSRRAPGSLRLRRSTAVAKTSASTTTTTTTTSQAVRLAGHDGE